jgi:2-methylisocitrate lyase-like PEP mutase family enzyme
MWFYRIEDDPMKMTTKLRRSLQEGMVVLAPCYDPLSARLAELAGFEALQLGGMSVEIAQLGAPDLGLVTATELVSHAARITSTLSIPLVVDIDTGFGGVLNVQRTIREMERAGVAGAHIEDQAFPKHCPILTGRKLVGRAVAIDRIKAALDARSDPDFLIIARTDGDVISFDEVVERCNLYLEAGADVAMPITMKIDGQNYFGLPPEQQMQWIRRLVHSIRGPVLSFFPPPGHTTVDLVKAGCAMTRFPFSALAAAANALYAVFQDIRLKGTDEGYLGANPGPFTDPLNLMRAVHLAQYAAAERRYSSAL